MFESVWHSHCCFYLKAISVASMHILLIVSTYLELLLESMPVPRDDGEWRTWGTASIECHLSKMNILTL